MELKEFIKEAVSQIADAVTELNEGTTEFKLIANPIRTSSGDSSDLIILDDGCRKITNIDFNLSLTTSENKGSDAKIGVFASVVGIGASSNENAQNESVSKINFTLPVLLPSKRAPY